MALRIEEGFGSCIASRTFAMTRATLSSFQANPVLFLITKPSENPKLLPCLRIAQAAWTVLFRAKGVLQARQPLLHRSFVHIPSQTDSLFQKSQLLDNDPVHFAAWIFDHNRPALIWQKIHGLSNSGRETLTQFFGHELDVL